MPYHVIQTLIDPLWEKGIHAYFKATNLARLDDELIDRLSEHPSRGARARSARSTCTRWAERSAGSPMSATAFAERSMPFVLNAVTGWHDADAGPLRTGTGRVR